MQKRYFIEPEELSKKSLLSILAAEPQIRFVSVAGIDLMGHETDAKIPIDYFVEHIDQFLNGTAVTTDGSSVILPGIATINNAQINMQADTSVRWWVDCNDDHIDQASGLPVSTLKIPCFLFHDGIAVDSRSVLQRAVSHFKADIMQLIRENPKSVEIWKITAEDVDSVEISTATELEFWVRAEEDNLELEEISTSQELKEQYWAKTHGDVRTGLESSLLEMSAYGLKPEMGHKEVGGVKSRVSKKGSLRNIMEQLEVDWRFDSALQTADNENIVKMIIKECFRKLDIDVTFLAKPLEGIAGSGKHIHISVALKLKDGRKISLFAAGRPEEQYLSNWGYGALMGLLNNYEILSPFVAQSNDAFRRLQKGYEAPICTSVSLGHSVDLPSRNRSVLIGLVREPQNPAATRFELRSPNPHCNTYLVISGMLQTMLDGIEWAVQNEKTEEELLKEISKEQGEPAQYLKQDRIYRTEKDIYTAYSDEERTAFFGSAPETVWENICHFEEYAGKLEVLKADDVFTEALINSYAYAVTAKWRLELEHRVIPNFLKEISAMIRLHNGAGNHGDVDRWEKVSALRQKIVINDGEKAGIIDAIHQAFDAGDYQLASDKQIRLYENMTDLRVLYHDYSVHYLP